MRTDLWQFLRNDRLYLPERADIITMMTANCDPTAWQVKRRLQPRLRRIVSAFVAASQLAATSALAQKPGRVPEAEGSDWVNWLILVGLAIVICLPAFLNPKRSHLT